MNYEPIKILYDKQLKKVFGKNFPIHIFDTGSQGNSIFYKDMNILIDLGLPYKRYDEYDKDFFNSVDIIIITHEHGDHFNPSTFVKVMNNYPHIVTIMTEYMYREITNPKFKAVYDTMKDDNGKTVHKNTIKGIGKGEPVYLLDDNSEKIIVKSPFENKIKNLSTRIWQIPCQNTDSLMSAKLPLRNDNVMLTPYTVKHGDIINFAIKLENITKGYSLLYSSDLDNLKGKTSFTDKYGDMYSVSGLPQNETFDFIFLEANYDKQILENWIALHQSPADKARAKGSLRHISEQESFEFIRTHLVDTGYFIPLHASHTFGTLIQ